MSDHCRKVLYSPGFGAGWSTWCYGSRDAKRHMAEYAPLIEYLENGGDPEKLNEGHPLIKQFLDEHQRLFGEEPYLGGLATLSVATVRGPYRVNEYDGSEGVVTPDEYDWM